MKNPHGHGNDVHSHGHGKSSENLLYFRLELEMAGFDSAGFLRAVNYILSICLHLLKMATSRDLNSHGHGT